MRVRPRAVNLCYRAEDPFVFRDRVVAAHAAREAAEAQIRYQLFIDCMPTEEMTPMEKERISRMLALALNTDRHAPSAALAPVCARPRAPIALCTRAHPRLSLSLSLSLSLTHTHTHTHTRPLSLTHTQSSARDRPPPSRAVVRLKERQLSASSLIAEVSLDYHRTMNSIVLRQRAEVPRRAEDGTETEREPSTMRLGGAVRQPR